MENIYYCESCGHKFNAVEQERALNVENKNEGLLLCFLCEQKMVDLVISKFFNVSRKTGRKFTA